METRLAAQGYRFDSLIETIVSSQQFLNKRVQATEPELQSRKAN